MIEAYCKQFFGYGRWDAPIWFVGLEEAGAGTPEELQARLAAWDLRGRRALEDAPTFYPACGQFRWHGPDATLQRTWRQLMRMLLLARGQVVGEDALLKCQKHEFGRSSGDVCLTELSPLPALNHHHWPYAEHLDLPEWVCNREQFMRGVAGGRISILRERIAAHQPAVVVFYFWKPRQPAEAITGGELCPLIPEKLLGLERDKTAYFVTGHPARGYPDSYFAEVGGYFSRNLRPSIRRCRGCQACATEVTHANAARGEE